MAEKENVHKGHRERMKDQFIHSGIGHFKPHQVLELLLFYAIPQKDTNVLAHMLINRFYTLQGVFEAPYEELIKVPGVSDYTATLIKMIPELSAALVTKRAQGVPLGSYELMADIFQTRFSGTSNEQIWMATLDNQNCLLKCEPVAVGGLSSVSVKSKNFISKIVSQRSHRVILAHNHPNGSCMVSQEDVKSTVELKNFFGNFGINLDEHVVVGNDGTYFMLTNRFVPLSGQLMPEVDENAESPL